ncbi:unnamed protein product [Amoebophrya sp. A25]|nr:unnamed protein product [Amoebophrya sp. A25]|eukprot:GSA25T00000671001.1
MSRLSFLRVQLYEIEAESLSLNLQPISSLSLNFRIS